MRVSQSNEMSQKITTFNRFLKIAANFVDLAARAPHHQVGRLKRIKKKHERNLARQNALPQELPRINWGYYRENLGVKFHAMLADYEKKYKAFKIPLPQHEFTSKFDALRKDYERDVQAYKDDSNRRVKCYDDALQAYKKVMPFSEMSMEEYCCLFPKEAPDYIRRPTFWPHTEEDQIGYVKPTYGVIKGRKPEHFRNVREPTAPKDLPGSVKGKVSKAPGRHNPQPHKK